MSDDPHVQHDFSASVLGETSGHFRVDTAAAAAGSAPRASAIRGW